MVVRGRTLSDGGRKGAVKLLSGGADVRAGKGASRGSSVEAWGNAAVLYLSVGQPGKGKRGVGDFWEEAGGGGGGGVAGGVAGGGAGGDIIMRPDEASFAGVAPEVMARFSGALTGRVRTMADAADCTASGGDGGGGGGAEDVVGGTAAAAATGEGDGVDKEAEGGGEGEGDTLEERAREGERAQQTALLFMRRPPGSFVFCGRLEAASSGVDGDGEGEGEGEGGGSVGWLRLVDTAPLRTSSTFHQLIGCRLLPEAPSAEV